MSHLDRPSSHQTTASAVPPTRRIFVSYRRQDTSGHVLALLPLLNARFGEERIFHDTDDIEPGEDFVAALERELSSCSVMLVVIGPEWLNSTDPRRKTRRLDDPKDFVRRELAQGLQDSRMLVVPVLVQRAQMPAAEDLPDELRPLVRRNAIELRDSQIQWKADVDQLISIIAKAVDQPQRWPRARRIVIGVSAVAIAGFLVAWLSSAVLTRMGRASPPSTPTLTSTSSVPPVQQPNAPPSAPAAANADPKSASLARPRDTARSSYDAGERVKALESIRTGLSIDSTDQELIALLNRMVTDAQSALGRSETAARAARADTTVANTFNKALDEKANGAALLAAGDPQVALRSLWASAALFDDARNRASRPTDASNRPASGASVATTGRGTPITGRDIELRPAPTGLSAVDRAGIDTALERFRAAYNRKDEKGILQAYPAAETDVLIRRMKNCARVNIEFGPKKFQLLSNDTAQVEIDVTYGCRANTGQGNLPVQSVQDTFQLARRDGGWVILKRLVPN